MTWKLALYDFIHARNQMELDYDWSILHQNVTDERFLSLMSKRQERRRLQHRIRGLAPSRSETRLRLSRIETVEDEVSVDIRLLHTFQAKAGGRLLTEERSEAERLTLIPRGRTEWEISHVQEQPNADRDNRAFSLQEEPLPAAALPGPYLSREGLSPISPVSRKLAVYNRELARQYADQYWDSHNPAFLLFDVDCSNYVSQCLLAGGHRMNYTGRRESGWWYRGRNGAQELWSYSWAVANALQIYLNAERASGLRSVAVSSPLELDIGDVICYSWEGNGRYGHSTIVTDFDDAGMPLVNAHTVNSRNRYWDYSDSYAWTERTQYRFFHILES